MAKITLSIIKADIGSIGGHIKPSEKLLQTVKDYIKIHGKGLIIDSCIGHTGDDIAILTTHRRGSLDEKIHKLS